MVNGDAFPAMDETVTTSGETNKPWHRAGRAALWIGAYVALVACPIALLIVGAEPKGAGLLWDFAMGLGFGGIAILTLQATLTARFRGLTAPFGIDIIYYFHRWAAMAGVALVAAHYVILRICYPAAVGAANPVAAPWEMTAGRLALGVFLLLVVSSLGRKALRIEYDRWRMAHAMMALLAVTLAIAHIWGVGQYTGGARQGGLWLAYTGAWVAVILYVRVAHPIALLRHPYRVTGVDRERGAAWTITLQPEGHSGFRFRPGQFAWLTLRASPIEAREHPFSFAGSAEDASALRFTIKELGDFTRTIKDVRAGEIAYVDGPHGVFTCDDWPDAPGFVFIAGGIGIAPIMSMLRTLADRGDRRPVRLVYGNRRWEDVVFREELQDLASKLDLTTVHVLQEPPRGWPGLCGVLSESVVRAAVPPGGTSSRFFLCGPKLMAASVQRTLRKMGTPLRRIHCELFDMA